MPIFLRLSEDSLLQRCKRGGSSQNQNESLRSVIWSFCPTLNYAGRRSIEAAICIVPVFKRRNVERNFNDILGNNSRTLFD